MAKLSPMDNTSATDVDVHDDPMLLQRDKPYYMNVYDDRFDYNADLPTTPQFIQVRPSEQCGY